MYFHYSRERQRTKMCHSNYFESKLDHHSAPYSGVYLFIALFIEMIVRECVNKFYNLIILKYANFYKVVKWKTDKPVFMRQRNKGTLIYIHEY